MKREECEKALDMLRAFSVQNLDANLKDIIKSNKIIAQLIKEHFDDESQIKFYYCESENSYLIGERVGNFYYAHWYHGIGFAFDMSRYLPWGEHIIDDKTVWKEHTYPSEPIEIDFNTWIKGFVKMIENDNPPLKFEEIHEGMWVWDNVCKLYLLVHGTKETEFKKFIYGDCGYTEFKESRFFRKQVEE